jgi:sortase (surface protein transpeptidase)
MIRPTIARGVLVSTTVALAVVVVSGSQDATERSGEQVVERAAQVAAPPVDSFRSVRSYNDVAEPVRLRIPAAGVDTRLQRLGRSVDLSIDVPTDFGVAGWFAEGPRPGQPGPAVILGHIDSRTGPAVFSELAGLPQGAEVLVDRADGSTVGFRVSRMLRVPKARFPTELVYGPTLEPSLRLVTCGGSFDQATGSYRDNVIVYADPR